MPSSRTRSIAHSPRKPGHSRGVMDIFQRGDLPFPQPLPEFQRLFPDDTACATYLEQARWKAAFVCQHWKSGSPFHFANRAGALRCRLPKEHRRHRGYSRPLPRDTTIGVDHVTQGVLHFHLENWLSSHFQSAQVSASRPQDPAIRCVFQFFEVNQSLFEREQFVSVVAGKHRTAYTDCMGNQLGVKRPSNRRKDPVDQTYADEPHLNQC